MALLSPLPAGSRSLLSWPRWTTWQVRPLEKQNRSCPMRCDHPQAAPTALLVVQHSMAVGEGAALHVLPAQPHVVACGGRARRPGARQSPVRVGQRLRKQTGAPRFGCSAARGCLRLVATGFLLPLFAHPHPVPAAAWHRGTPRPWQTNNPPAAQRGRKSWARPISPSASSVPNASASPMPQSMPSPLSTMLRRASYTCRAGARGAWEADAQVLGATSNTYYAQQGSPTMC